jgi:cell division protein FtsL|tara:strand:- start:353 stop:598 length:246 start_codon:yes stop_codon:yes gene_type:complete
MSSEKLEIARLESKCVEMTTKILDLNSDVYDLKKKIEELEKSNQIRYEIIDNQRRANDDLVSQVIRLASRQAHKDCENAGL